MIILDEHWARAHPLALPEGETDKNRRGRALVVGGSMAVPGAVLLAAEAAYRAGAGKVQIATPEALTAALGVRIPEAAVFGLATNADGEVGPEPGRLTPLMAHCDAVILGPGLGPAADAARLLGHVLSSGIQGVALLLDAGILPAARACADALRCWSGPLVLTPHAGEMAALMGCGEADVHAGMAQEAADLFGAVLVLKGAQTRIAVPGGASLHYAGGGAGLATGGSGDVLAGLIGGLLARGIAPDAATGWGVFAHGECGRAASRRIGVIGFLAHELLPLLPGCLYPGGETSGR